MAAAATGRCGRSGRLARAPRRARRPDLTMARVGRGRPARARIRSRGGGGAECRPARAGWSAGAGVVRGSPRQGKAARRRGGQGPAQPLRHAHLCRPRHRELRRRRPETRQLPLSPWPGSPAHGPNSLCPGKASPGGRVAPRPVPSPPLAAWRGSLEWLRPRTGRRDPVRATHPPCPAPPPQPVTRRESARSALPFPSRWLCDRAVRQPLAPSRFCRAPWEVGGAGHGVLEVRQADGGLSSLPRLYWSRLSPRPRARRSAQGCGTEPGKRGSRRAWAGRGDCKGRQSRDAPLRDTCGSRTPVCPAAASAELPSSRVPELTWGGPGAPEFPASAPLV